MPHMLEKEPRQVIDALFDLQALLLIEPFHGSGRVTDLTWNPFAKLARDHLMPDVRTALDHDPFFSDQVALELGQK